MRDFATAKFASNIQSNMQAGMNLKPNRCFTVKFYEQGLLAKMCGFFSIFVGNKSKFPTTQLHAQEIIQPMTAPKASEFP